LQLCAAQIAALDAVAQGLFALPYPMLRTVGLFSRRLALRIPRGVRPLHVSAPVFVKVEPELQDNLTEVLLEPPPRPNENTETKRARLLWQSRKRGILETCVILGKFAKLYLPEMSHAELEEYDQFMNENDWDIYYWVTNTPDAPTPLPERWQKSPLMVKLRQVGENKEREIMVQPDLD